MVDVLSFIEIIFGGIGATALPILYAIYNKNQKRMDKIEESIKAIAKNQDKNQFTIDLFSHLIEKELPRMLRLDEEKRSDQELIQLQKLMETDKASPKQLARLKEKLTERYLQDPKLYFVYRMEILGIDSKLKRIGREDLIPKN